MSIAALVLLAFCIPNHLEYDLPLKITTSGESRFPPYLSELTHPDHTSFSVHVSQSDTTTYLAFLKFTFTQDNFIITNRKTKDTLPLHITGKYLLIGTDQIHRLLHSSQLSVFGEGKEDFFRSGILKEGTYHVFLQLFDFKTGTPLSELEKLQLQFVWEDVPVLAKPQLQKGGPLSLSWQHALDSTLHGSVEYLVEVATLPAHDVRVEEAFISEQIILTKTVDSKSLTLDTPSGTGMFAVRVTAIHTRGRRIFKSEGRSNIVTFSGSW